MTACLATYLSWYSTYDENSKAAICFENLKISKYAIKM